MQRYLLRAACEVHAARRAMATARTKAGNSAADSLSRQCACRDQAAPPRPSCRTIVAAPLKKRERGQHEQQAREDRSARKPTPPLRDWWETAGRPPRRLAGPIVRPSSRPRWKIDGRLLNTRAPLSRCKARLVQPPSQRIGSRQREIGAEARHRKRPVIKARRVQPGMKLGEQAPRSKAPFAATNPTPPRAPRNRRSATRPRESAGRQARRRRRGQHEAATTRHPTDSHQRASVDQLPAIDLGARSRRR